MPTKEQLEARKNHIGASDVGSILGLNPYKSAYDVWLEKTGKVESQADTIETKLGKDLEQVVLNIAENELGKMERNPEKLYYQAPNIKIIGSNLDAQIISDGSPVEAKTTGIKSAFAVEHWGEAGTDDIPDRIVVQCATQLLCAEKDICYVPALIGGRGYCLFAVHRDNELINIIIEKMSFFWDNYVIKDIPPEDTLPSMKYLKKMIRQPKSVVDLTANEDLISQWLAAKETKKMAEKEAAAAEIRLLEKLGTAEAGNFNTGLITYYEQHRKGYTVQKSTFRVLRFSKTKELSDGKK